MSIMTDMSHNDRLEKLEKKIKKLEKMLCKGENKMSNILSNLIGQECKITADDYFDLKAQILEVDDEWIKLLVHDKKKDNVEIIRMENIESFEII